MNKSDPQLSVSFDLLRKEIQERDEVIGMLKKKLQVMESFHCSSSSLDALNKHHHSSIFVLPEPFTPASEEFPSPKLKSFGMMTEAASGGGAGKRKRCYTDTGVLSLASEASPTLRTRRASLFDHDQRLRIPSFLKIKREEDEAEEKKKTGFFKRLLKQIKSKFQKKPTENTQNREKNDSQASIASLKPHYAVELSYEQIISGHFGSLDISLDKVENYLKSDDCIEWLGVAKEQLKYLRQDSLEFRKRRVFLCADQLRNYPKEI